MKEAHDHTRDPVIKIYTSGTVRPMQLMRWYGSHLIDSILIYDRGKFVLTKSWEPAPSPDRVRDDDISHLSIFVVGCWPKTTTIKQSRSFMFAQNSGQLLRLFWDYKGRDTN